jgi:hypothetical protein
MKFDFSFIKDLPTWLKTSLVLVAVVAGVIVFFVYARVTNTDDTLCNSCHPVIYQQWHESRFHPQSVSCYECHAKHLEAFPEPGESVYHHYLSKVIPEKFHSADSYINDNCLRCHGDIPKSEEVKKTRIIKISHAKHFKGKKVKIDSCLVCHFTITHDKYSLPTNRPRMQGCFTGECHQAERNEKRCELCHFVKLVEKGEVLQKPREQTKVPDQTSAK